MSPLYMVLIPWVCLYAVIVAFPDHVFLVCPVQMLKQKSPSPQRGNRSILRYTNWPNRHKLDFVTYCLFEQQRLRRGCTNAQTRQAICFPFTLITCADPEGGGGGGQGARMKNHKNIGFLSNTGPDPLEYHSQYSMLCHHRHAIETPFKWRFEGGSMMTRL